MHWVYLLGDGIIPSGCCGKPQIAHDSTAVAGVLLLVGLTAYLLARRPRK